MKILENLWKVLKKNQPATSKLLELIVLILNCLLRTDSCGGVHAYAHRLWSLAQDNALVTPLLPESCTTSTYFLVISLQVMCTRSTKKGWHRLAGQSCQQLQPWCPYQPVRNTERILLFPEIFPFRTCTSCFWFRRKQPFLILDSLQKLWVTNEIATTVFTVQNDFETEVDINLWSRISFSLINLPTVGVVVRYWNSVELEIKSRVQWTNWTVMAHLLL